MLESVRARLTLWHTAVVAVLVGLFAAGAYAFVAQSSRARTDATVLDAVADLRDELLAERQHSRSTSDAAREVLGELRFRTITFMVLDSTGGVVAATLPGPTESTAEE